MSTSVRPILASRAAICREILRELPDWFGIPESLESYAQFAEDADTIGVFVGDDVAGVLTLRDTSLVASEIHVMGIRPAYHRRGLGSALVAAACESVQRSGRHYLTVKTLGPSRANAAYAATRRFYEAVGFEPIEEFSDLWEENPCLFMIKALGSI